MYFKCVFEDGTETYKDLNNDDLRKVIDEDVMVNLIGEETGENVEEWDFTEKPTTYSDVVQVDVSSAVITENLNLIIDDKKVLRIDLLEGSTYEHALATLSLTNPKALVYSTNVLYVSQVDDDDYYENYEEDDGGYNDEPPDYDYN